MRKWTAGLGLIIAMTVFGGCSFEAGKYDAVSREKLGQLVSDGLTKQVGQRPDNVACPNDLPATVGSMTRCVLTAGGTRYGVTVRVTSVVPGQPDRDELAFDVDQKPM